MFEREIKKAFETVMAKKGIAAETILYKSNPIQSVLGNDAYEFDMWCLIQWFAFTNKCYIKEAALVQHESRIYVMSEELLNSNQASVLTEFYESHRLHPCSKKQLTLYAHLATMTLLFNDETQVNTPVEFRGALTLLENDVLVLDYTKIAYASITNPNRNALSHQIVIGTDIELSATQIPLETSHEISAPDL
ncbi:hypothetical protein [Vibrio sp. Hal054]|uniref:hypothetical protein n=1 Tax=Vibrio sp. Hal054 TaxID=3035158 RepID=UPI00301E09C8